MAEPVYLSGNRIQGRSDDSVTAATPQTSWKQLAKNTLSSAGDVLDSGTFTAKDNLMILVIGYKSGSASTEKLQFNADDQDNYAERHSENGGNDSYSSVAQDHIELSIDGEDDEFTVLTVRNTANQEKLVIGHTIARQSGTGASNVPTRWEVVGKWANTSNQITRVQVTNPYGGDLDTGSEMVVLGCDDDEADSGTNFWQELADVDLSSGAATTLSTGTITAKKYLWVQGYSERNTSGTHQPMVTFNDDAGSNYAVRRCNNGGSTGGGGEDAEQGWGSQSKGIFAWKAGNKHFTNSFIINTTSQEKLMMIEDTAFTTAGASDGSPFRSENLTKWANTSAQITSIKLSEQDGHTFDTQTSLRVWGSN